MKDDLKLLVSKQEGLNAKMNMMREYLQALVLRSLHECEAFRPLAFVGGTALRFLYGLPRFSADAMIIQLEQLYGYSIPNHA